MSKTRRYGLITLLALATLLLLVARRAYAESQPANVIFFLADDHRNDRLGCAGHPVLKTPSIDRLAKLRSRTDQLRDEHEVAAPQRPAATQENQRRKQRTKQQGDD